MPELPDVTVYVERLRSRLEGKRLARIRLIHPFVLRSVSPRLSAAEGRRVAGLRRLGKRIVFELDGRLFLIVHLMIAGRLHWHEQRPKLGARMNLAAFTFDAGTLVLTEAGTTRRASIHLARDLGEFDRGGLEALTATHEQFAERLRRENHTLKRSLTDPRLLSGIGNAYSDEILHRAKMSPLTLTSRLTDEGITQLFAATKAVLVEWTDRLRREAGEGFPEKVTAFREGMAVHGRYLKPCPVCGARVQRIRYADNETNYCARCQTGGRLLADRSLSRLMHDDWPKTLDELDWQP